MELKSLVDAGCHLSKNSETVFQLARPESWPTFQSCNGMKNISTAWARSEDGMIPEQRSLEECDGCVLVTIFYKEERDGHQLISHIRTLTPVAGSSLPANVDPGKQQ